jgi:hypothetical protein
MTHKNRTVFILSALVMSLLSSNVVAKELLTNAVHMADAPKWLTGTRVDKVVDRIQQKMEWDIHRIEVTWYPDAQSYAKASEYGPSAIAITKRADGSIHLGPRITDENFDRVFGHEIVHVISLQKYKGAIPAWLEEGLANFLAKNGTVDYKWLAKQKIPADVKKDLVHPFNGDDEHARYTYMASQALAEMLNSKCGNDMPGLLRLSVGRTNEDYLQNILPNICKIDDINVAFKKWIDSHK